MLTERILIHNLSTINHHHLKTPNTGLHNQQVKLVRSGVCCVMSGVQVVMVVVVQVRERERRRDSITITTIIITTAPPPHTVTSTHREHIK